jgi:PAS domain S-box-containing protein
MLWATPMRRTLAFAALYAAAAVVGRATRLDGTQLALVWPAAGVAFVWVAGSWRLPAQLRVDLATLVGVTVLINVATGAPVGLALAFALANLVQAGVACAVFFRLSPGAQRLMGLQGISALIAGAVAGSAASAAIGPLAVWLTTDGAWPVHPTAWILRNAVSTFVVGGAGLALALPSGRDGSGEDRRVEFVAFTCVALAAHVAVFGLTVGLPVAFLVLVLSCWAGVRYSARLAAVHNLLTGTVLIALTLQARGPFAELAPTTRVVLAQAFLAVATVLTLVLAVHRDERQRLVASLRAERDFTDTVLATADALVVVLDVAGRIVRFNDACEAVSGRRSADVVGRPFWDVVLPDDEIAQVRGTFGRPAAGDFPNRHENVWKHAGGDLRRIAWSNTCLTDEHGAVQYVVGTGVDVTEQRRSEAALGGARDAALEASRMKSAFLANMSHEIRTPMNGVIGMSELLLDTSLDAQQRGYAESVRLSGEGLLAIINDILDFSKIEAGKLDLHQVPFALRDTVEEVCEQLAPQAQAKGVELAVRVDDGIPALVGGDPARVQQILQNLVGNAVKFTDGGEVEVTATVDHCADGLASVRLAVRDTGIGIAPEVLPTVFASFAQADMASTRRFGGTGLGLAICRQLAELMDGTIDAVSTPGVGSTFALTVPLRVVQAGRAARPRNLAGMRVLVVDDSAATRSVLAGRLAAWGMRADTEPDAPAALQALLDAQERGAPYALALLDADMPGIGGITLAGLVHAEEPLRRTALVLLTSVRDRDEPRDPAVVSASLAKPVRDGALRAALAAALDRVPAPAVPPADRPRDVVELTAALPVLVAEDNPINQTVATMILRKRGLEVELAVDGRQAVELVGTRAYAAVFMDCQMPELDGFAATAEIRRRHGPAMPIIAMTANAMRGDRERCLQAGMDDYLTKPLRAADLEPVLARWLGVGAPAADAPRGAG